MTGEENCQRLYHRKPICENSHTRKPSRLGVQDAEALPALAVGIKDRLWNIEDIVAAMVARAKPPAKLGSYKKSAGTLAVRGFYDIDSLLGCRVTPLRYHPHPGTILICHYGSGFTPPEMVKPRPAVVISPRLRNRDGLCTIVPLSTTEPKPEEHYHHKLTLERPLPHPFDASVMWAKCDMLSTVSFSRLELIKVSPRKYITPILSHDDLDSIRRGVLFAIGIGPELDAIEKSFARLFEFSA
jgi:mRNA interferase MazF